jgi:hypothetical protein
MNRQRCGCWDPNAWHKIHGMMDGEVCMNAGPQCLKPRQRWIQDPEDDVSEWKDFTRASGDALCSHCGAALSLHHQPLRKTCPTMVEDCIGRWWKL